MDELMDLIISDESPSQISDKIKELIFARAEERIDQLRPFVASSLFNSNNEENVEEE